MAATTPPPEKLIPANLHPKAITLSTFRTLLAHYEETVHRVTRKKAIAKQGGKKSTAKQKKNAAPKRKASSKAEEGGEDDDDESKLENENVDEDGNEAENEGDEPNPQADAAVREFWKLDTWRYETLPRILSERAQSQSQSQEGTEKGNGNGKGKGKGKVEGAHMTKDEVIKLMEWKLKHGIYRPTLMGMLKSNPGRAIQSATATAFASLPSLPSDTSDTPDESLSATLTSLNALTTPLRGIGPATASLLLSAASPAHIPFYSDDTFLWLIVGIFPKWDDENGWVRGEVKSAEKRKMVKPSGELIAKYHVAEYKALFEAVRGLVGRLNGEREALGDDDDDDDDAKGEEVGCADLEKVAFVIRHVGETELAGIKAEGEDEEEKGDEDVKVGKEEGEGESRKKRKVRK